MNEINENDVNAPQSPPPQPSDSTATSPPPAASAPKRGRSRGCFGLFVIGMIVAMLLVIVGFCFIIGVSLMSVSIPEVGEFQLGQSQCKFTEKFVTGNQSSSNKIVQIDIDGVIMQGDGSAWTQYADANRVRDQIECARRDPATRAVIIKLNTPGGEVVASDVIHHAIKVLREETHVPVVASMGSLAASGGYYVAVACDHITANRLTTTGSIGVIIQSYDYYELFKKVGLQAEVYKSGPMKDILNGARPRTPEEVKIVQSLIQEVYDEFVKLVAEGRADLTVSDIKNSEIGDGRVLTGQQALKLGLVDQLGFYEDAVDKAAELAGLGENYKVIRYERPFSLASIFSEVKADRKPVVSVELPGQSPWASLLEPGKLYLLPAR